MGFISNSIRSNLNYNYYKNGVFSLYYNYNNFIRLKYTVRMTYTEEHIRNKLFKELDATHVDVVDESDGCGGKFSCVIVSEKFKGKPLLQRHRLVNSVLQEELKSIHAFSQKTFTPEQWAEQNK